MTPAYVVVWSGGEGLTSVTATRRHVIATLAAEAETMTDVMDLSRPTRAYRAEMGLCLDCGQPAAPYRTCPACRQKKAAQQRQRRGEKVGRPASPGGYRHHIGYRVARHLSAKEARCQRSGS